MNKKSKETRDPVRVKKLQGFIGDSTLDYLASRMLFLNYMPVQASILASTAIEKALKAYLSFNGNESHGHLKKAHWTALKNFDRNLYSSLSEDFLLLNQKVYKMRYTDDLTAGYNVVIATNEYLAELDYTIMTLLRQFEAHTQNPQDYRPDRLQTMINQRDARLWQRNHVLLNQDKNNFIYSTPQYVHELRNYKGAVVEASYSTNKKAFDPSFLREALIAESGEHLSFRMSHDR
ncbi:hypothetical protein LU196_00020 [Pantoea sp. Mb-10]|uniref:hypothetical protein n=1 Tax=unclassified Pantoea TaxID=2630326 RepID=UPI001E4CCEC4|nr:MULTISPECIES: hypothetical protein [unclassified Pantoea]MCE0488452.1 hypothetical protein [Pantoea sp. Mb-10]MCE0500199.1 hypothetical protein [Pantoea sp. Pb-8]